MGRWIDALLLEGRQTLRSLARSPGLSATVVLALGLGIGANAAMFELVDRQLLRPPPYLLDPASVHRVYVERAVRDGRIHDGAFGYPGLRELREGARSLSALVGVSTATLSVARGDDARSLPVDAVSAGYWNLFDARPALGRFFADDEHGLPSGSPVVVLAHDFWRSAFGADPEVLGRELAVGRRSYTVIGVAPEGFRGTDLRRPVAWVPLTAAGADIGGPEFASRPFTTWMDLFARRAAGVAPGDAARELERLWTAHMGAAADPARVAAMDARVVLTPVLRDRGPHTSDAALISVWLLGMSAVVLLAACANVSTLLLGRALRRRRDVAVRAALGVGRGRLFGAALLESLVLAAAASVVVLVVAQGATRMLTDLLLTGSAGGVGPGLRAAGVAGALTLAAGAACAVLPARQARSEDLAGALRRGGSGAGRSRSGAQTALVGAQAALSAVLLVGAGLFVRSVVEVRALDLGYEPDRVALVSAQLRGPVSSAGAPEGATGAAAGPTEREAATLALLETARSAPGVEAVALTAAVPFWRNSYDPVYDPDGARIDASFATHVVSEGYFEAMGTPVLRGRALGPQDVEGAPPVMVVSESMARLVWSGQEAVGRCLRVGADTMPCREVVGVAQDIRRGSIDDGTMLQFYVPWQQYFNGMPGVVLARTRGPAATALEPLRRTLQGSVGDAAWVQVQPLSERVALQTRAWRLGATVFGAFGLLALALSALGLFSVVSYETAMRTREFGVRMAFGARALDLGVLVVRRSVVLVAGGLATGLGLAWLFGAPVEALLFDVRARDPATFAGVAAVLLATALAAALLPALRSARVAPQTVLRSE